VRADDGPLVRWAGPAGGAPAAVSEFRHPGLYGEQVAGQTGTDRAPSEPGPGTPAGRPDWRRLARRVLVGVAVATATGVALWIVYGVGIDTIVTKIQNLPAVLVVTLVFLLPALEASVFVGVVFPGEVVVLVGGVAASNGKVSLLAVLIAACLGAVLGDQVGYVVGREWGARILQRIPDRFLDSDRLENAQRFIRRAGAKGVVVGRWTAALRAFVPGLAGMARMHYPRFLAANILGGVGWAVACTILGYLAGAHFHTVEKALGNASSALLALIAVALVVRYVVQRRRRG
jgi:membrane-associated protein